MAQSRQQQATDTLIKGVREAGAALLLLLTVLAALLLQIITQSLTFLALFARPIGYVLMVGGLVLAIFVTLPIVHAAYGDDAPALLPAVVVCLLPILLSLGSGKGVWTLWVAAGEIFGAGAVIQAADWLARGAIVSTVIAAIVAYEVFNRETNRDEENVVVNHAGHSEAGAVALHGQPDAGPVSKDSGC